MAVVSPGRADAGEATRGSLVPRGRRAHEPRVPRKPLGVGSLGHMGLSETPLCFRGGCLSPAPTGNALGLRRHIPGVTSWPTLAVLRF